MSESEKRRNYRSDVPTCQDWLAAACAVLFVALAILVLL